MLVSEARAIAARHLAAMTGGMVSSATLCLEDACGLEIQGKDAYALARAAKSLAYSVGIGHPDYIAVKAAADGAA